MDDFSSALELIKNSRYVLIITHIEPDIDTTSSALALFHTLKLLGVKSKVFNDTKELPSNLMFLDGAKKIVSVLPKFYDLVIAVDCGDKSRFFPKKSNHILDDKIKIINIDHHISNDNFGDINIVYPNTSSTAEIVANSLIQNNIQINKQIASLLYAGIYSDTIGFSTQRVDRQTFKTIDELLKFDVDIAKIAQNILYKDSLAKYKIANKVLSTLELKNEGNVGVVYLKNRWLEESGASMFDVDECANSVLKIGIVKVAVLIKEFKDKIGVSLKGKINFDLSSFVKQFGGGGHKLSAGCSFDKASINEVKDIITISLIKELKYELS